MPLNMPDITPEQLEKGKVITTWAYAAILRNMLKSAVDDPNSAADEELMRMTD